MLLANDEVGWLEVAMRNIAAMQKKKSFGSLLQHEKLLIER